MAIAVVDITRVRALAGITVADFNDAAVTLAVEAYPKIDSVGLDPTDEDWTETYDLYRAAADIVDQRSAAVVDQYDQNSDGASLARSQKFSQLTRLASRLRARAAPRIARRVLQDTYEDAYDDDDEDDDDD